MAKYKFWTTLNDEGKKLYGEVFPDGIVPILDVLMPQEANLTDDKGNIQSTENIYRVDLKLLSDKQRDFIVNRIAGKNNVNSKIILDEFTKMGFIPIRQKYTCGAGTTETRLFL